MNFRITFHLDGSGVYFDPANPIHLDALLAWCLAPMQGARRNIGRGDAPDDIQLPLLRSMVNGHAVWHASALFVAGDHFEGVQFWRKRFRVGRIEWTSGSPNLTNGVYRDWNQPMPLVLCRRLVAFASGSRKDCKRTMQKQLKYIGKKRAHGWGKITGMEFDEVGNDYSLTADGVAMRWLPTSDGQRLVRPCPPYWSPIGRVMCCEVGDAWPTGAGQGGGL